MSEVLSRLFAIKVIEDVFCLGQSRPLLEPELWLFSAGVYDGCSPEGLRAEVFRRIKELTASANPVIRRFAGYGFFFNWIEAFIDPVQFRSLVETFAVHDFARVEADLLGRFYEIYAQRIHRHRRKELGQYYTPLPVVQFIWSQATAIIRERQPIDHLTVLDPAMGSGTFLAEGARRLARSGIAQFWECLTGFDIAPQVLGIAHVNLYMAILSQLTPGQALAVEDLKLYATDSLDSDQGNHLRQLLPLITDDAHRLFVEQRVAINTQAKRSRSYTLVIGNPPYRNNSNLTLGQVGQRFPRLLATSVANSRAQERNIRDDYAWFIAAADHYVNDEGLICFILSDSFAVNQSYRYFRAELLRHYHVRTLVRLGPFLFLDVGYRTDFVILIMEKRAAALENADQHGRISYIDLRSLIADQPVGILGTESDPRLVTLREVARGQTVLNTIHVTPNAALGYSFYPAHLATTRFRASDCPLYEKDVDARLFIDKWPGIITAFDKLFKGSTIRDIEERMVSLFGICSNRQLRGRAFTRRIEEWGAARGFTDEECNTLVGIADQIRQLPLQFQRSNIKRRFSGSIPADAKWYPPAEYVHYLYYEPQLAVPRRENPGKRVGWGTMNQWREACSHRVNPKLIYTTASDPRNGYAAFVVEDEWYVKLHGGKSQQFHYTGLENPCVARRLDEHFNNLSEAGLHLCQLLTVHGGRVDDLLYYVAAVWNSMLAVELLREAKTASRPKIRVPTTERETTLVRGLAENGRAACAAQRLRTLAVAAGSGSTLAAEGWMDPNVLAAAGFPRSTTRRKGFRSESGWTLPADAEERLKAYVNELEAEIDQDVGRLYE